MKARLKKKLEKENIFIKNFASEYKRLNKTKGEIEYCQKVINHLRVQLADITPNEVIISKAMYFALVGYLPADLKVLLGKYKELTLPIKLGSLYINVGMGLGEDKKNLLEELYIEEINEEKQYIMFLFKGFQIRIKVPIKIQHLKTRLKGVDVETTCWNWDFIHAGIRVVSDNDFSSLIVFYKTATEVGSLLGMSENSLKKLKAIEKF